MDCLNGEFAISPYDRNPYGNPHVHVGSREGSGQRVGLYGEIVNSPFRENKLELSIINAWK